SGSSISSFAIYLGCFGKWNKLRNVGRQFFFPAPSVDSALISFERTEMRCNPSMLEDILRSSFHSKRKKISNSWKSAASLRGLREEWLLELAPAAELDPGLRPEEVPPEKFYELARLVDQQFGAQIRAQA
ncbi:MAG TPA: rRNA adenine N-6-methyltransferase family protein, partial [Leptospiraceae bacterium]|nr:rRNA adenine N-6-methyltransferase family protein [Leptospiraceae bacterium]